MSQHHGASLGKGPTLARALVHNRSDLDRTHHRALRMCAAVLGRASTVGHKPEALWCL